MNNRLIIQDIAGLLAEKTGKSKSECERFLRTFVAVVSEGLMTDKQVKVKGIGIFKLGLMEQRESVDVNTGERFVLPVHYKCTFLPDSELKELVNAPFSFFETVELSENADVQLMDTVVEDETEQTEPASLSTVTPEPVADVLTPPVPAVPAETPEMPRNRHRWGWISTIGVFLVILCGVFLYIYMSSHFVVEDSIKPSIEQASPDMTGELTLSMQEEDDNFAPAPLSEDETDDSIALTEGTDTSFKEVKIIKIKDNDRLTYLAEEYYGNRVFWVYIYQFNKTVIRNPDVITVGMELILPDPALYGINANDSVSIRKAMDLEKEIKEGKK